MWDRQAWLRGISGKGHGLANPPALPDHSRPCFAPRAPHSFCKNLSFAKNEGHSKPALWFWRKWSKLGYEFLKAEDCQTFIKAVLKFSVTSTSACINRTFFSKSTVVCFYLHYPLMSLPRELDLAASQQKCSRIFCINSWWLRNLIQFSLHFWLFLLTWIFTTLQKLYAQYLLLGNSHLLALTQLN